jgi:hypothetical protein
LSGPLRSSRPSFPGHGSSESSSLYPPEVDASAFTVTAAGEGVVSQAYNAHIDECVRRKPEVYCPFGTDGPGYVRTRNLDLYDLEDVKWRVRKYLTIMASARTSGFSILERERGTVELSATGRVDGEGPRKRFTVGCEIRVDRYVQTTIDMAGRASISGSDDGIRPGSDPPPASTCRSGPASAT